MVARNSWGRRKGEKERRSKGPWDPCHRESQVPGHRESQADPVHYSQHWPCTNGSWADTQLQLNLHMVPFQLESGPIATFLPYLGRQMDKRRKLDGGEGEPPGSRREGDQGQRVGRQKWEANCSPTGKNSG